ncbi:MAG: hypothetical protein J1E62_01205 [Lachnospiraceae bacterium]|nr:hypothetical protein [Lachnospiraceae bacterium]
MKQVKRILAIVGVVLIIGMYVVTFLSAIFVKSMTGTLFIASVVLTLFVPLLIYVVQMVYRMFSREEPVESSEQKNRKAFAEAAGINRKQTQEPEEIAEDGAIKENI